MPQLATFISLFYLPFVDNVKHYIYIIYRFNSIYNIG
jgi:hypothetical protein